MSFCVTKTQYLDLRYINICYKHTDQSHCSYGIQITVKNGTLLLSASTTPIYILSPLPQHPSHYRPTKIKISFFLYCLFVSLFLSVSL